MEPRPRGKFYIPHHKINRREAQAWRFQTSLLALKPSSHVLSPETSTQLARPHLIWTSLVHPCGKSTYKPIATWGEEVLPHESDLKGGGAQDSAIDAILSQGGVQLCACLHKGLLILNLTPKPLISVGPFFGMAVSIM